MIDESLPPRTEKQLAPTNRGLLHLSGAGKVRPSASRRTAAEGQWIQDRATKTEGRARAHNHTIILFIDLCVSAAVIIHVLTLCLGKVVWFGDRAGITTLGGGNLHFAFISISRQIPTRYIFLFIYFSPAVTSHIPPIQTINVSPPCRFPTSV